MRRLLVLLAVGGALTAGVVALTRSPPTPSPALGKPNVVLISIDTLRANFLSTYGYGRPTSPTIDALAKRGVLFEQAFSHSCKTAVSHMSLLTGLYPDAHGVRQWSTEGNVRLSDDIPTLATILHDLGYRTAAVTGGGNVRAELGFDQGFDVFESPSGKHEIEDTAARLEELFEGYEPFFLFVHTYAVHAPYIPEASYRELFLDPGYAGHILSTYEEVHAVAPGDWAERNQVYWERVDRHDPADVARLRDLYATAIRQVDDQVETFLDALERAGHVDDTLIILVSDHGEEFLEHGRYEHDQLYEVLLHVPLIVVFPGRENTELVGRREGALVRLIDVVPTILEFLDLPMPMSVDGESLMPLLRGRGRPPELVVARWPRGKHDSVRDGRWKLIRSVSDGVPTVELYDVETDPEEKSDVSAERTDVQMVLDARLDKLLAASLAFNAALNRGRRVTPDRELVDRLKGLGYLQ